MEEVTATDTAVRLVEPTCPIRRRTTHRSLEAMVEQAMHLLLRFRLRITMEADVSRTHQLTRSDVTRHTEKDGSESTGMEGTLIRHLRQEVLDTEKEEAINRTHRLHLRRTDMTTAAELE